VTEPSTCRKGLDAEVSGALGRGGVATHYDRSVHVQQEDQGVAHVHEEEAQKPEGVDLSEPSKELNQGRAGLVERTVRAINDRRGRGGCCACHSFSKVQRRWPKDEPGSSQGLFHVYQHNA
jgi:hypothetical protein